MKKSILTVVMLGAVSSLAHATNTLLMPATSGVRNNNDVQYSGAFCAVTVRSEIEIPIRGPGTFTFGEFE